MEWSPDGEQIITIDSSGDISIWDAANLEHIRKIPVGGTFRNCALSPDGTRLARGWKNVEVVDLTGNAQGKLNRDFLNGVVFNGVEVIIEPLGDIGEVRPRVYRME